LLRKKAKDRLEYWRNYREPEPSIENQPSITISIVLCANQALPSLDWPSQKKKRD